MMKRSKIIDIDKLKQLAKSKEEQNYRFRTFLKLHADPDDLDKRFRRLHEVFFRRYDCTQCRNCCIKYCGFIPDEDIAGDAAYLGMTEEEFKAKYLKPELDENGYYTKNVPCDFLKNGECVLGEFKPDSCAEFPYTDKEDRWGSLISIIGHTKVCPVVYEIMEELKKEYHFR